MLKSTSSSKYKTLSQIALAGYIIALLTATHLPPGTPFLPSEQNNVDKIYHFATYAILAGLLATTWQLAAGVLTGGHLFWVWVAVAAFGAMDEITQIPVSRDCDFWDWVADASGALAGLLLFAGLRRLIARQKPTRS